MLRRPLSILLAGAALAAGLSVPGPVRASEAACTDTLDEALPTAFGAEDGLTGHFALPSADPQWLVVFAHGYGNDSSSWLGHLRAAADHGALAVAMDYRGLAEDKFGWPVRAGAEDSITAARHFLAACPTLQKVVMFGVSMGGNASGIAVSSRAYRDDGSPLFDYWFDVEGVNNLIEEYLLARAAAQNGSAYAARAVADMEAEAGGTLVEAPLGFLSRTNVYRTHSMFELEGAVLVHGADDGTVPYDQTRQMAAGLAAVQVPTEVHTVLRRGSGESGTTLTGAFGFYDELGMAQPPTAGHGWEGSSTHLVIRTAFDRLWSLMAGELPTDHEVVVDEEPTS